MTPFKHFKPNPTVENSESEQVQPTNGRQNLPDLPVELLLEVISYFPVVAIPAVLASCMAILAPEALDRADAVQSLSQTCHRLRNIFLPVLWESLDACAVRYSCSWYLSVARKLEKQSNVLVKNKDLAAYVRIVNVSLTRCSTGTVLPAFVRCICALPNLHTLQIVHAHSQMTSHLKEHFEGHHFPAVRKIILPSCAHNILRCCPEVRVVICNKYDGGKLITAISKECKKVEVLEGFMPDEKMMKRLVKAVPNLRSIKFGRPVTPNALRLLVPLKNISSIELWTHGHDSCAAFSDPDATACIRIAEDILNKAEGKTSLTFRV